MGEVASPVAFALFSWWFGTGLVFLFERALRRHRKLAIPGVLALGAVSFYGIVLSASMRDASGAYLGFAASVGLWGALELSFLSGLVTGPRRMACAAGCRGWRHFGHGIMALLYHELALAACAAAVAAACHGQPNVTAACTFGLLWVMRESAKLNLFLGVRNTAAELLPGRLSHLACYFGSSRINPLLPVSIGGAALVDFLLVRHTLPAALPDLDRAATLLLATLLALAIVEHVVLVLPIRADALWTWATRQPAKASGVPKRAETLGSL